MPKKILLVAATQAEMLENKNVHCETLVTGVGMVATTFSLTQKLQQQQFDLVINIGIAGAFDPLPLGTVVQVISDCFSELGVEDKETFIPADEINLMPTHAISFKCAHEVPALQKAKAITVNRVHGSQSTIQAVRTQFNPDIESMEGAAVSFVCQQLGIPWVQIRAISNRVEPRNRAAWNIPLAINNLHTEVLNFLSSCEDEA